MRAKLFDSRVGNEAALSKAASDSDSSQRNDAISSVGRHAAHQPRFDKEVTVIPKDNWQISRNATRLPALYRSIWYSPTFEKSLTLSLTKSRLVELCDYPPRRASAKT